jgi:hypothetical protein
MKMRELMKKSILNLEKIGHVPTRSLGTVEEKDRDKILGNIMIGFSIAIILFGLLIDTPSNIVSGLFKIIIEPDYLITDYIGIGGIGAAFVNAGVLTLFATIMLQKMKDIECKGMTLAAILTFAGFSFFGKNLANVWPVMIGVYAYSVYKKENFSKHVYTALFGTAISPMLTSIALGLPFSLPINILIAALAGVAIGFFFAPAAAELVKFHQGFDLYNIGFTAGMIGSIIVLVAKSYGFVQEPRLIWTTGHNLEIGILVYGISFVFVLLGVLLGGKKAIEGFKKILCTCGRLFGHGYVERHGFAATLINMGVTLAFMTTFILIIGGDLNGPILAGLFTVMGFAAMGKNVKNIIPILIGIMLGGLTKPGDINEPGILLAFLFGTGLAPVSGEFGSIFGVLVGFVHSSVVLNVGALHGGFNLYNNGFSIGIITGFLIPIMETIKNSKVMRLGDDKHKAHMKEIVKSLVPLESPQVADTAQAEALFTPLWDLEK